MGKIAAAVRLALEIAADETHGYDQTNRWGPDYDCASFIITVWENVGVPVKTNGATVVSNMRRVSLATGFTDITASVNRTTGAGLQAGDVLIAQPHCEMMVSATERVGAHINELGTATGGETGDQTGTEISVYPYSNYPWLYVLRYTKDALTPGNQISKNAYLTESEMQINAKIIYSYLSSKGWTLNAIAGMLGNMETESTINPGIWENLDSGNISGGYGLVQWTPATNFLSWAQSNKRDSGDIIAQLDKILDELANGEQYYPTPSYPETFAQFSVSDKTPEYLAQAFLLNYERPADQNQPARSTQARKWFNYLSNYDPGVIIPPGKKKGMDLLLLIMATRRRYRVV